MVLWSCHKIIEVYEHIRHPCNKGELRVAVPKGDVPRGRDTGDQDSPALPIPGDQDWDSPPPQRNKPKGDTKGKGEDRAEKQQI